MGSRSSRIYSYPKERSYLNEIMLVSQILNSEHSDWDIHNLKSWFENSVIKFFENSNLSSCGCGSLGLDSFKFWGFAS